MTRRDEEVSDSFQKGYNKGMNDRDPEIVALHERVQQLESQLREHHIHETPMDRQATPRTDVLVEKSPSVCDLDQLSTEYNKLLDLARTLERELSAALVRVAELERGLSESVKLQKHYAELLNMHDGGQRMLFASTGDWLARLRRTGAEMTTPPSEMMAAEQIAQQYADEKVPLRSSNDSELVAYGRCGSDFLAGHRSRDAAFAAMEARIAAISNAASILLASVGPGASADRLRELLLNDDCGCCPNGCLPGQCRLRRESPPISGEPVADPQEKQ